MIDVIEGAVIGDEEETGIVAEEGEEEEIAMTATVGIVTNATVGTATIGVEIDIKSAGS
jgi:hypothetical protein